MSQEWLKAKNLKIGSQIAVYDDGNLAWDEIVSIESKGRERVYDIEVEGTHNFVAGHLMRSATEIAPGVEPQSPCLLTEDEEGDLLSKSGYSFDCRKKTKDGVQFAGIVAHNTYIGGNLGIGTTSPYSKLALVDDTTSLRDVFTISTSTTSGLIFKVDSYGRTWGDGAYSSPAADYAEYFYTNSVGLQSGEVVCVDIVEPSAVARCERGADNNVMGIVSTKPSVIGNFIKESQTNPEHYAIIGMLGQVDAFVSTENGAINIGDSLTSASSTPGYAMRADGGDSTVAIALESLKSGAGKIKVLISRRNKSLAVEEVEALVVERIANMKIEDRVAQLITEAVDNLDLDPKIQAIAQEEAGKLDGLLTVSVNDLNNRFTILSSAAKALEDKQFLMADQLTGLNASNNKMMSVLDISAAATTTPTIYIDGFGNMGIGSTADLRGLGTSTADSRGLGSKLVVVGDIAATGFVNLSAREAKKDIEYLTSDDYASVLEKISGVKVASYYYNSDEECSGDLSSPQMRGGQGGVLNTTSPNPSSTEEGRCARRLGLIAEEAPREVLSADGKGVDLYKLASWTLAGVKALSGEMNDVKIKVDSLEARMEVLENNSPSPPLNLRGGEGELILGGEAGFQLALETLGGEKIELAPSSIAALVDGMYSSVLGGLRQMGLIIEQGIVRAQKLAAGILQTDKLVVNTAQQTDANGATKDATIGSAQINVGELDTYIMNNQVSTTTKIFVTPEMPVALGICEMNALEQNPPQPSLKGGSDTSSSPPLGGVRGDLGVRPQGFRVCANETSSQIIKFSWWIVETTAEQKQNITQNNAEVTAGSSSAEATADMSGPTASQPSAEPSPEISPIGPISPISPIESTATPTPSPEATVSPEPSVSPEATP